MNSLFNWNRGPVFSGSVDSSGGSSDASGLDSASQQWQEQNAQQMTQAKEQTTFDQEMQQQAASEIKAIQTS